VTSKNSNFNVERLLIIIDVFVRRRIGTTMIFASLKGRKGWMSVARQKSNTLL